MTGESTYNLAVGELLIAPSSSPTTKSIRPWWWWESGVERAEGRDLKIAKGAGTAVRATGSARGVDILEFGGVYG